MEQILCTSVCVSRTPGGFEPPSRRNFPMKLCSRCASHVSAWRPECVDWLVAMLLEHRGVLASFWERGDLWAVAVVSWSFHFAVGMEEVAGPFFEIALGLTPSQIGLVHAVKTGGFAILCSPVFGWLQDRYGGFAPIFLSTTVCGLGCFRRSFARGFEDLFVAAAFVAVGGVNEVLTTNAYIVRSFPPSRRTLVYSSFILQQIACELVGQACYLPWNSLLQQLGAERLLRFRLTSGLCLFMCAAGLIQLVAAKPCLDAAHAMELQKERTTGSEVGSSEHLSSTGVVIGMSHNKVSQQPPFHPNRRHLVHAALGGATLVMQSLLLGTALIAWPLWLAHYYVRGQ